MNKKKLLELLEKFIFIMILLSTQWIYGIEKKISKPPFDITNIETYGFWEFVFVFFIIPSLIFYLITWILVQKKYLVIFYGIKDLINCVWAFALPLSLYISLWFLFLFIDMDEKLEYWILILFPSAIFILGYIRLILMAWTSNPNKLWVPYVILMKTIFGAWIGISIILAVIAWNIDSKRYPAIRLIRALVLILGLFGFAFAYTLTTYPKDERNSQKFLSPYYLRNLFLFPKRRIL